MSGEYEGRLKTPSIHENGKHRPATRDATYATKPVPAANSAGLPVAAPAKQAVALAAAAGAPRM